MKPPAFNIRDMERDSSFFAGILPPQPMDRRVALI